MGDLSGQLRAAQVQQQELEMGVQNPQVLIASYREQINWLDQRIDAYDQELANLGPTGGNRAADIVHNILVQERNSIVLEQRRLGSLINQISNQKQQFNEMKQQFNAEVARLRESYTQTLDEPRKSVDELIAKYAQLKDDETVTNALADLSRSTKMQQKLGPSKALGDATLRLKRYEGSVRSETVELHRENGVDHIDVTLNGKGPVRMVFDTGAGPTLLSAALAERLGLRPTGRTLPCRTADGTQVIAKEMIIRSVIVGRLTVKNVTCAVLPKEKGDVTPLFGQTILERFDFKYTQGSGRLVLTAVDSNEPSNGPPSKRRVR